MGILTTIINVDLQFSYEIDLLDYLSFEYNGVEQIF